LIAGAAVTFPIADAAVVPLFLKERGALLCCPFPLPLPLLPIVDVVADTLIVVVVVVNIIIVVDALKISSVVSF
jgi:hypothetical protein